MGEGYLILLDIFWALFTTKISSRTSFFGVHFQPLIGQVGDAPSYLHQVYQKVKLDDAPTCFHLGFTYIHIAEVGDAAASIIKPRNKVKYFTPFS